MDISLLLENILSSIKTQLNEGVSQRLFHFCPINSMYSIAKDNCFKLTSVDYRPSDKKMTSLPVDQSTRKQYNYYMCFSRTPSSLMGYVAMRRNNTGGISWKQSLVRIEVDGERLMNNYKGMAVNYFNDKNLNKINHYDNTGENGFVSKSGNRYSKAMQVNALTDKGTIYSKTLNRYTPHADDKTDARGKKRTRPFVDYGVIDRNQMLEYEDRIFSNKEFIPDAKRYIKQIDIFINKRLLYNGSNPSNDLFYMIDEIISVYGNLVHIYDNFSSFEGRNIVDSIPFKDVKKALNKQYKEISQKAYRQTHGDINIENSPLTPKESKVIARYAIIASFNGDRERNWQVATRNRTFALLKKIKIKPDKNLISYIDETISYIGQNGKGFFRFQSNSLKKEMDDMPVFKREKYLYPIFTILKQQEKAYEKQTGKAIGFLSVKYNMVSQ